MTLPFRVAVVAAIAVAVADKADGAFEIRNEAILVFQEVDPVVCTYSVVNQNVMSSAGSTDIML